MSWGKVGDWLKENATESAVLIGSLLSGNVPKAIAAGAAMVSSATGVSHPDEALSILQNDPSAMIRLKEISMQENQNIRKHLQEMYEIELSDKQHEHEQTQMTIRNGDTSADPYVRHTRPLMARQSWYCTAAYVIGMEVIKAFLGKGEGAQLELALVLAAPGLTYLGWRTADKFGFKLWGKK